MYSDSKAASDGLNGDGVAIRIEGLSKNYALYDTPIERLKHIISPGRRKGINAFQALSGVTLTIRRGETCAIVGRNGSGKSTLLQILCGTLRASAGRIEVNGRVAALLELGAGFNLDFTGRENVYMNGAVLGLSKADIDARFSEIEAFAEIGSFIDQPVKTYSSGMYVRLAFAVAIHVNPQVLIIDEALAVGDSRFQAKCLHRIKAMQAEGVTILFVSHDVGMIRTLCERALWLDQGRVRMLGDAAIVTSEYSRFLFEGDPIAAMNEPPAPAALPTTSAQGDDTAEKPAEPIGKARPITHWGSHVGAILEAGIYNASDELVSAVEMFEDLEVRVKIRLPQDADRTTMSVAISLKDLRGTDLIVSTTWDHRRIDFLTADDVLSVRFKLRNQLNSGDYHLAVALEDRAGRLPHYYEYIEGAHYFRSLAGEVRYGTFLADVEQVVDAAPARTAATP